MLYSLGIVFSTKKRKKKKIIPNPLRLFQNKSRRAPIKRKEKKKSPSRKIDLLLQLQYLSLTMRSTGEITHALLHTSGSNRGDGGNSRWLDFLRNARHFAARSAKKRSGTRREPRSARVPRDSRKGRENRRGRAAGDERTEDPGARCHCARMRRGNSRILSLSRHRHRRSFRPSFSFAGFLTFHPPFFFFFLEGRAPFEFVSKFLEEDADIISLPLRIEILLCDFRSNSILKFLYFLYNYAFELIVLIYIYIYIYLGYKTSSVECNRILLLYLNILKSDCVCYYFILYF